MKLISIPMGPKNNITAAPQSSQYAIAATTKAIRAMIAAIIKPIGFRFIAAFQSNWATVTAFIIVAFMAKYVFTAMIAAFTAANVPTKYPRIFSAVIVLSAYLRITF